MQIRRRPIREVALVLLLLSIGLAVGVCLGEGSVWAEAARAEYVLAESVQAGSVRAAGATNRVRDRDYPRFEKFQLWSTDSGSDRHFGAGLSIALSSKTELGINYDSSFGNKDDTGWTEAFKAGNLSLPPNGLIEPSGSWSGWISHPNGSAAYGYRLTGLSNLVFDYQRPVAGLHVSGAASGFSFDAFSGQIRQESQLERIPIRDDRTVYYLSNGLIIPGSEMVQIQVYESDNPQTIIDVFYPTFSLNYESGELKLEKSPLARIGQNPAYLVVSYDYQSAVGKGYLVQGGTVQYTEDGLQARGGFLKDARTHFSRHVLTLGGTWGNAERYINIDVAVPVADSSRGVSSDGSAWAAETSIALGKLRLSARAFRNGIAFPFAAESFHKPGESGWSLDTETNLLGNDVFAGYGITYDASFSEYAGILTTCTGQLAAAREIAKGVTLSAGHASSTRLAPDDPMYKVERAIDSWAAVNHQLNGWNWGLIYGWGTRTNTRLSGQAYDFLATRLYGVDFSTGGDAEPSNWLGFRREVDSVPGEADPISLKDSLVFGLGNKADTLEVNLSGTLYRLQGRQWLEPRLGGSSTISLSYTPSTRLSVTGNLSLHWFESMEWSGTARLLLIPWSGIQTALELEKGLDLSRITVGADWSPNGSIGRGILLNRLWAKVGAERSLGSSANFHEAGAEITVGPSYVLTGSFAVRDPRGLEAINTYKLSVARTFGDRYQLGAQYEYQVGLKGNGEGISQRTAAISGKYALSPELAAVLGYSWGGGFPNGTGRGLNGIWLGIENGF